VPFGYAGIPVVTGLSTHLGPTVGGTRVTITGRNLRGVTSVNFVSAVSVARFGESTVDTVTGISARRIRVIAPGGIVGAVDVEPCTPSGCSSAHPAEDLFEFYTLSKPQLTSVSPSSGSASGGDLVTILGNNLAGALSVHFGPNESSLLTNANGFAPGDPNAIAVFAPPGRAGSTVAITVVTRSGRTTPHPELSYTYLPSGPSAPLDLSEAEVDGGLLVRWDPPISSGGSPVVRYTVSATAAGGFSMTVHASGSSDAVTLKALPPTRPYAITVTATNAAGRIGLPSTLGSGTSAGDGIPF
jgi:hypothetical protein